jgi:tripeptidyl-peptidase-1
LLLYAFNGYFEAYLLRQASSLDLSRWEQAYEADADYVLQVSIALAIQNTDLGVETLLQISDPTSPDYGQHLSAEDVFQMFRPKPDAISGVMEWLGVSGVDQRRISFSHGGGHLTLDLTVQEATSLLQTTSHYQKHQETGQEQIAC